MCFSMFLQLTERPPWARAGTGYTEMNANPLPWRSLETAFGAVANPFECFLMLAKHHPLRMNLFSDMTKKLIPGQVLGIN